MGLLNSPVLGSPSNGYPWSFWLCIWVAAAVSALLGVAIGAPTLRVRGRTISRSITLGFGEIIPVAIRNLGDITLEIGGWRPIERLNLTGGENGVNPDRSSVSAGRPLRNRSGALVLPDPGHRRRIAVGHEPAPRLAPGPRVDGDPRGRDGRRLHGREPDLDQAPGLRARRLVLGFAGSVYAAKLQAITPGAFEFQVSIMLLCMVVPRRRRAASRA